MSSKTRGRLEAAQYQQQPAAWGAPQPPQQLPPGWACQYDSNTGHYYYTNAQLGLTQWEVPLNTGAPAAPPPQYAAAAQPQQQQAWGSPNPSPSRAAAATERGGDPIMTFRARAREASAAMEAVENLQARGGASSVALRSEVEQLRASLQAAESRAAVAQ